MKSKFLFTSLAVLFVSCLKVSAQTGFVIKDLTTGVSDATHTPIAYGSDDDTWKVLWPAGSGGGLGYKPTKVCTNLGGAWATDNCGRWITHKLETGGTNPDCSGAAGTYVYQTHFELNTSCLLWVKINFTKLGADNRARRIRINGHLYTIGSLSWEVQDWYNPMKENITVNIDLSHLVSGTNTIDFEVDNDEACEGLFICGNVTQNYCP